MKCPRCNADTNRVINSRDTDDALQKRRMRECRICKTRFTTIETITEATDEHRCNAEKLGGVGNQERHS